MELAHLFNLRNPLFRRVLRLRLRVWLVLSSFLMPLLASLCFGYVPGYGFLFGISVCFFSVAGLRAWIGGDNGLVNDLRDETWPLTLQSGTTAATLLLQWVVFFNIDILFLWFFGSVYWYVWLVCSDNSGLGGIALPFEILALLLGTILIGLIQTLCAMRTFVNKQRPLSQLKTINFLGVLFCVILGGGVISMWGQPLTAYWWWFVGAIAMSLVCCIVSAWLVLRTHLGHQDRWASFWYSLTVVFFCAYSSFLAEGVSRSLWFGVTITLVASISAVASLVLARYDYYALARWLSEWKSQRWAGVLSFAPIYLHYLLLGALGIVLVAVGLPQLDSTGVYRVCRIEFLSLLLLRESLVMFIVRDRGAYCTYALVLVFASLPLLKYPHVLAIINPAFIETGNYDLFITVLVWWCFQMLVLLLIAWVVVTQRLAKIFTDESKSGTSYGF